MFVPVIPVASQATGDEAQAAMAISFVGLVIVIGNWLGVEDAVAAVDVVFLKVVPIALWSAPVNDTASTQ